MSYIILELFPEPFILVNEENNVIITQDIDYAIQLKEECQSGFIVQIPEHLISKEWIA